jgi:hypothetical protein
MGGATIMNIQDAAETRNAKWMQIDVKLSDGSVPAGEKKVAVWVGTKTQFLLTQQNIDTREGEWSTSDSSIASVDENGLTTGLKEGVTKLKFTTKDGKHKDEIALNVYNKATSFKVNQPEVTIHLGDTYKPSYTVVPNTTKVIPILAQSTDGQHIYYEGNGTLQMNSDGSVVAVKSGIGVIGFRYGVNTEKDGYTLMADPGNGYLGIAKVRVVMGPSEFKTYLEDTQTYIDRVIKSTKEKTINDSRDFLTNLYVGNLSKAEMDNPNFEKLKSQIIETNTALDIFFNSFGLERNADDKEILLATIQRLQKVLTEVKTSSPN